MSVENFLQLKKRQNAEKISAAPAAPSRMLRASATASDAITPPTLLQTAGGGSCDDNAETGGAT